MFWWKVYILKVSKWLHIKWGKLHPLQFISSLKVSSFAATCGQHSWIPIKNSPIAEAPEALLSYCRLACLVHIWKLLFSILSWICMKFTTFKEFSTHILLIIKLANAVSVLETIFYIITKKLDQSVKNSMLNQKGEGTKLISV